MGLSMRSNGYYFIDFRDEQGSRHKISLKTKDKNFAEKLHQKFLFERMSLKLSRFISPPPPLTIQEKPHPNLSQVSTNSVKPSKSLDKAFKEYLNWCEMEQHSIQTMQGKKFFYKLITKKGITSFADINSSKLVNLWKFCKDHYKDDSTRKFTAHIKAFLRYCIRKGYYSSADYDKLDFPKLNTKARDILITAKDWALIQDTLKVKDYEFLLYLKVLWNTGVRPSEGFQLVRSKIDFTTGETTVFQNKTKSNKTVFLPKSLLEELRKFNSLELIFSPDKRDKEYFSHKFSKLKKSLKLNEGYNLYAFRHTFASNLLNHNGDLHLVSKLLGHADVSITAKHYINRSNKDLRDKLADWLDRDEPH